MYAVYTVQCLYVLAQYAASLSCDIIGGIAIVASLQAISVATATFHDCPERGSIIITGQQNRRSRAWSPRLAVRLKTAGQG